MKRSLSILAAGVLTIACTSRDFTGVPIFITSVTPTSGPVAGGTLVVVRGTGLPFNANVLVARFDDVDAPSFTIVGDTLATVTTPPHAAGLVSFTVILKTGDSLYVPAAFTYTASAPSGNPTITSITRNAGSAAGGAVLVINGTGFASGASVTFGGVASPHVDVTSPTQLTVTVPAHTVGVVDVSVIGNTTATLPNAFEYLPAPTTTYFSHGFEDNTLGPLSTGLAPGGSAAASTDFAFAGTRSGKTGSSTTPGGGAAIIFDFGGATPANPAFDNPGGVYLRWYMYVPQATVNLLQATTPFTAQIKLHLFRQLAGSGQPGWAMCGLGADFPPGQNLTCFIDNGVLTIPGGATNIKLADNWVEVQFWYKRSGGTGRARGWVNGREFFDVTNAAMGIDGAATYRASFGAVYIEANGPTLVYIDNVAGADGFIDP